jgi:hypothetical protein
VPLSALVLTALPCSPAQSEGADAVAVAISVTSEHSFESHDGHEMFAKLTLPPGEGPHPVMVYVQAAEGMTVDMKRPGPGGTTFEYFDLYAKEFPARGVGFFRCEGRGIRNGTKPPRFE